MSTNMSSLFCMHVSIYHNILWSKYKGGVFSQVYVQSQARGIGTSFIQIAETDDERIALGDVDLSYHQYPFRLLFRGAYSHPSRWRRVISLVQDVLKNSSDLVVIPGYHRVEYWAMLFVCILLRRKRAVFCDSTEFDRPKTNWREIAKRVFFSGCDGFFCYGIRSKEYLMKYGAEESKIVYRCQAAALPHEYDPAKVLARYEALPRSASKVHRFTYVGRLSIEKGLFDLLEAFAKVHSTASNVRLDLVGAGPLRAELIARVSELKLEQVVSFLGAKNIGEIAELFIESTASVLPSHSEPWGLVVNESLSYGCPVVVSNVCGCVPDLVVDGVTGYSFEVGDVEALSGAMLSTMEMAADRVAVARQCLAVISEYTPNRAAAQILDGCARFVGDPA
jgi:glycosyltransferase involved in cell wall biosynthesis